MAVTGATGFIGRRVVVRLLADGWAVRALVRRHDQHLDECGVELQSGSVADRRALEQLVAGVTAVVHCAGAVRAGRHEFQLVNRDGTRRLADAVAASSRPPRVVLLSSLAARAPEVSAYAASKRAGEMAVQEVLDGRADVCVVRPPAVYGPGDRATLPLFQQLHRGVLLVPAGSGRFSLLFVEDLAALIGKLLSSPTWGHAPLEPDDGHGGYGWRDLAGIAAQRLDRRVRIVPLSRRLASPLAVLGEAVSAVSGQAPMLTRGKVRELFHPDWVCRDGAAWLGDLGWCPTTFENGFAATMSWYRQNAWL